MVEFDREESNNDNDNENENENEEYNSNSDYIPPHKSNIWRNIFIIFLLFIIIGLFGLFLLFQQYQETTSQKQIKVINESLQLGYNQGRLECPVCPEGKICESTNVTVKNLAVEQTNTGNIILYNGTHIVSIPIKSVCERIGQGAINATS